MALESPSKEWKGKSNEISQEHVESQISLLRPGCYYLYNVLFFLALCVELGWDCFWRMA